jgi:hypothetical protein
MSQPPNQTDKVTEHKQKYISNLILAEQMRVTVICADLCKTAGKEELELDDRICLRNCGYNRMYLHDKLLETKQTLMK